MSDLLGRKSRTRRRCKQKSKLKVISYGVFATCVCFSPTEFPAFPESSVCSYISITWCLVCGFWFWVFMFYTFVARIGPMIPFVAGVKLR